MAWGEELVSATVKILTEPRLSAAVAGAGWILLVLRSWPKGNTFSSFLNGSIATVILVVSLLATLKTLYDLAAWRMHAVGLRRQALASRLAKLRMLDDLNPGEEALLRKYLTSGSPGMTIKPNAEDWPVAEALVARGIMQSRHCLDGHSKTASYVIDDDVWQAMKSNWKKTGT